MAIVAISVCCTHIHRTEMVVFKHGQGLINTLISGLLLNLANYCQLWTHSPSPFVDVMLSFIIFATVLFILILVYAAFIGWLSNYSQWAFTYLCTVLTCPDTQIGLPRHLPFPLLVCSQCT